ncbi:unnamed protein product [Mytilus coruscus]|uniref:Uncharacterized protein n=1 Tax=Mytilus coruscus TaxID=42192 RepID=A0A6J8E436_MYTCO|nr:unnamed protein product [Mytilus coruscus]
MHLNCLHAHSVKQLYVEIINVADDLPSTHTLILEKVILKVLSVKSLKIKHLYEYYMSRFCWRRDQLIPFENLAGNKFTYKHYKTHMSTLLLSTHHDAVFWWLLLASYFYRTSQYSKALYILQYTLLKFLPEKPDKIINFSDFHSELLNLHLFRKLGFVQWWNILLLDYVIFMNNSTIIPKELEIGIVIRGKVIPSEEYAHFLWFLCEYHLTNTKQCIDSFQGLRMIIDKNYVKQL